MGTPLEITDVEGSIAWAVDYQAYGNVARERVRVVNSPLRFQGQYFDEETGLHYNRHRYYSPETGRFITVDPIGLAGGLNNYQYVKNPTGWVDPLGLVQKKCKLARIAEINKAVSEVLQSELDAILYLDPDAIVGVRGSLARGTKGAGKGFTEFNPDSFDVDAFIISDGFSSFFSSTKK